MIAAAGDEVSAAVASLFSEHAQAFQALSAQAPTFHAQFVQTVNAAGGAYTGTEAANASPLQSVQQDVLGPINAPFLALTGRPLIGNGANGAPGTGANGAPGGWLIGNGGAGGSGAISTSGAGQNGGQRRAAGLFGVGGGGFGATTGGNGGESGLIIGNGGGGGSGGDALVGTGGNGGDGGNASLIGDGGSGGNAGLVRRWATPAPAVPAGCSAHRE